MRERDLFCIITMLFNDETLCDFIFLKKSSLTSNHVVQIYVDILQKTYKMQIIIIKVEDFFILNRNEIYCHNTREFISYIRIIHSRLFS